MKKLWLVPVMVEIGVLAGCVSTPTPVEVQLQPVAPGDIWDVSKSCLAVRLFDPSNPLSFLTGSYFSMAVQNVDTGEIDRVPFSPKDEPVFFPITPGKYRIKEVVSDYPEYTGPPHNRQRVPRIVNYVLPAELGTQFSISGGEIFYIGKLTTKDELFKSVTVYQDTFAEDKAKIEATKGPMAGFQLVDYSGSP